MYHRREEINLLISFSFDKLGSPDAAITVQIYQIHVDVLATLF